MRPRLLAPLALASLRLLSQDRFPLEARSSFQTISLPFPGERMGLYGLEILHEGASGWAGGLGGYGAVTGKRGGFITLGLAGAWRPHLTDRLSLDLGLFSGGGGAGRAAVGGGWMLEGHGGLDLRLDHLRLGLAYQRIHFPNGDIDSRQWRFSLGVPFSAPTLAEGITLPAMPWSEVDLESTFLRYAPPSSVHLLDGASKPDNVGLVGFAAKSSLRGPFFLSLELAAAHSGQAEGYMEGLLGLGMRREFASGWRAHLRIAGGPAGGGRLDVGGGMAWKLAGGLEADLPGQLYLGAEVGWIATPGAGFKALTTQASVGRRFRVAHADGEAPEPGWTLASLPMRVRVGVSEMTRPRALEDGPVRSQTLALDLPTTDHLYITGQAGFGTSGRAGGWATGLLGLGLEGRPFRLGPRTFLELLFGAGGGGGLDSRGGAIVQPMVGLAQPFGRSFEVQARAGRIKALRGGLESPIYEVGLAWRVGLAAVGP